jgi:hypothetical protein
VASTLPADDLAGVNGKVGKRLNLAPEAHITVTLWFRKNIFELWIQATP